MPEPYKPVITLGEQLECARRELRLRGRVYPRRVEQGHMTQKLADHETAAMQAIIETLEKLAPGEKLI